MKEDFEKKLEQQEKKTEEQGQKMKEVFEEKLEEQEEKLKEDFEKKMEKQEKKMEAAVANGETRFLLSFKNQLKLDSRQRLCKDWRQEAWSRNGGFTRQPR